MLRRLEQQLDRNELLLQAASQEGLAKWSLRLEERLDRQESYPPDARCDLFW